jgi:hypothetical protein
MLRTRRTVDSEVFEDDRGNLPRRLRSLRGRVYQLCDFVSDAHDGNLPILPKTRIRPRKDGETPILGICT